MGEGPTPLVENLRRTDHFSRLVDHGGAENRSGKEPCFLVKTWIKSQVRIGVLNIDRLPACENRSGDTQMVRKANLRCAQTLPYFGIQFLRLLIVNEKGRALSVKKSRNSPNDLS